MGRRGMGKEKKEGPGEESVFARQKEPKGESPSRKKGDLLREQAVPWIKRAGM